LFTGRSPDCHLVVNQHSLLPSWSSSCLILITSGSSLWHSLQPRPSFFWLTLVPAVSFFSSLTRSSYRSDTRILQSFSLIDRPSIFFYFSMSIAHRHLPSIGMQPIPSSSPSASIRHSRLLLHMRHRLFWFVLNLVRSFASLTHQHVLFVPPNEPTFTPFPSACSRSIFNWSPSVAPHGLSVTRHHGHWFASSFRGQFPVNVG